MKAITPWRNQVFNSSFLCSLICETNILNKHTQRKLSLCRVRHITLRSIPSLSLKHKRPTTVLHRLCYSLYSLAKKYRHNNLKRTSHMSSKQESMNNTILPFSSRISIRANKIRYPGLSNPNFDSSRFTPNECFIPILLCATSKQKWG